jgi:hypothetical protein
MDQNKYFATFKSLAYASYHLDSLNYGKQTHSPQNARVLRLLLLHSTPVSRSGEQRVARTYEQAPAVCLKDVGNLLVWRDWGKPSQELFPNMNQAWHLNTGREESILEAVREKEPTPESTPREPIPPHMSNCQNHLHVCCWERILTNQATYKPRVH